MKLAKKICALSVAVVLLCSVIVCPGLTVSALDGAGIPGYADNLYWGCDVSFYNVGDNNYANGYSNDDSGADYSLVDFEKMKADGCDFVILRLGSEDSSGRYYDPHFVTYYNMAREADMDIGLYYYSYALTYAEAAAEAQFCINVVETYDMYFEYPLYIDIEESDQLALGETALSNVCYGWCDTMVEAGYFPGIYGNYSLYDGISSTCKNTYDTWIAWVSSATSMSSYSPYSYNLSDECGMWQYSFYGYEYDGIGLDMLDVNVAYKDYPAIMEQYGYNNIASGLSGAVNQAKKAVYTDYTEQDLATLHRLYDEAVAMLNDPNSTEAEQNAMTELLKAAIADTVQSGETAASGYVFVDGFDTYISAGASQIFTSDFGTVNATSANTLWTINMKAKWDASVNSYVVDSVWAGGGTDVSVDLGEDEFFVAVHSWEDTVAGSEQNASNLLLAEAGYGLELHGIDIENKTLGAAPYIEFYALIDYADYTAYNAAVSSANALSESDYTADTWAILADALSVDVKRLPVESQSTVDAATQAILDAIDGLEEADADYTAYNAAVASATALSSSVYTEDTWATLENALATDVSGLKKSAQSTVDAATQAILDAIDGLEKLTIVVTSLEFGTTENSPKAGGTVFTPTLISINGNPDLVDSCISSAYNYWYTIDAIDGDTWADYNDTTFADGYIYDLYIATVVNSDVSISDSCTLTLTTANGKHTGIIYPANNTDTKVTFDVYFDLTVTVEDADYTAYNAAVESANALVEDDYTADSWAILVDALAVDVSGLTSDAQATVDAAAQAILDAIDGLEEAEADYTDYNAAVESANALNESDYTADTWAILADALAADVSGLKKSDQATVDAATQAILDAIDGLAEADADYTAYNAAVESANALNESDYTADTWAILADALAVDVSGLKKSNQATVDAATQAILDAIDGLVDAPVVTVVLGDLDCNGIFDGADVVVARQYDASSIELDADLLVQLEVTGDGIFDGADVVAMAQMDAGSITDWPRNG